MILACVLLILVVSMSPIPSLPLAHGLSSGSSVYVDENSPITGQEGTSVTVTVRLTLAADQSINAYDARLNYTGFGNILLATSIDTSNNVFTSLGGGYPVAECIDGVIWANTKCASDDFRSGLIHVALGIFSNVLNGPVNGGVLFSATFRVNGNGTSLFTIDRANLLNPGVGFPSNPQYVPVITKGGVFGNSGVVAFFNYATSNPSISPSPLPTVPVSFDAGLSFDATGSNSITSYSWIFGDGATGSGKTIYHTYNVSGTYQVFMKASTATASGNITRSLIVFPALGTLLITVKGNGGPLPSDVVVRLYNSSQSSAFVSRVATLGNVTFTGLVPGSYQARFSGTGVINSTRTESVTPGWTNLDTVYLDLVPPTPNYGGIIFLGSLAAAIFVFLGFLVFRWRRTRRLRPAKSKRLRKNGN